MKDVENTFGVPKTVEEDCVPLVRAKTNLKSPLFRAVTTAFLVLQIIIVLALTILYFTDIR